MRIDKANAPSAMAGFLRRRSSMPMWMDLTWRVLLLFGLISLVLLLHWIGRDGLKDNLDNQISFIDVLYFTTVTVTTVGYGDIAPITPMGRFIASIIMIMGYGIIAVPTGIVTSEMTNQQKNPDTNTQACPNCMTDTHLDHATYCHKCGNQLNE